MFDVMIKSLRGATSELGFLGIHNVFDVSERYIRCFN